MELQEVMKNEISIEAMKKLLIVIVIMKENIVINGGPRALLIVKTWKICSVEPKAWILH